jgi:hypothetical protein
MRLIVVLVLVTSGLFVLYEQGTAKPKHAAGGGTSIQKLFKGERICPPVSWQEDNANERIGTC